MEKKIAYTVTQRKTGGVARTSIKTPGKKLNNEYTAAAGDQGNQGKAVGAETCREPVDLWGEVHH